MHLLPSPSDIQWLAHSVLLMGVNSFVPIGILTLLEVRRSMSGVLLRRTHGAPWARAG